MNRKGKELCRNFQRGSCKWGAGCRFLHPQQQQQPQQQSNSNPFGFGQPSNNNQSKPFENKWSRFSNASGAATASASAGSSQSKQTDNHSCDNPDACKSLIVQDYEQEQPSWKLTCYGHVKNGPCDIIGDISYEELRAVAYDDAKRGLSLQSIVERERNLLSSKLVDVQNFLRNPYVAPSNSRSGLSPFPGVSSNAASSPVQNSAPPSVSTFGQLGAMGFRPAAQTANAFTQLNHVPNSSQTLNVHGPRPSTPSHNIFGQSVSNFGQSSSAVGMNPSPINAGPFGSQPTNQTFGSQPPNHTFGSQPPNQTFGSQPPNHTFGSQTPNPTFGSQTPNRTFGSQPPNPTFGSSTSFAAAGVGNSGISNQNNAVHPAFSVQNSHSSSASGSNFVSSTIGQLTTSFTSSLNKENVSGADSIWLKEKWLPGEIPEEAPSSEFVF